MEARRGKLQEHAPLKTLGFWQVTVLYFYMPEARGKKLQKITVLKVDFQGGYMNGVICAFYCEQMQTL